MRLRSTALAILLGLAPAGARAEPPSERPTLLVLGGWSELRLEERLALSVRASLGAAIAGERTGRSELTARLSVGLVGADAPGSPNVERPWDPSAPSAKADGALAAPRAIAALFETEALSLLVAWVTPDAAPVGFVSDGAAPIPGELLVRVQPFFASRAGGLAARGCF